MSRETLQVASELIKEKKYAEAAAILRTLPEHPQAQKWLQQMEDRGLVSEPGFAEQYVDVDALPDPVLNTPVPSQNAPGVQVKQSKAIESIAVGAVLAAAIGAIWVYMYLTETSVGFSFAVRPLWDYVAGDAHGSDAFESVEALFVVVTRFLLAFGATWLPASVLYRFLEWFIHLTPPSATD